MSRFTMTVALLAFIAPAARADLIHFYYVGVDSQTTLTSGTYTGLANPNYNHLTFLYGHQDTTNPPGNHYHAKGSYSYTGPNIGAGTAVNPYNGTFGTSNAVRDAGVFNLLPGSGSLAGKYVSGLDGGDDSGNTLLRSVDALKGAPANSMDWYQYHSASNRWTTALTGTHLQLNLVGVTGGVSVVDSTGKILMSKAGDSYDLGSGDLMAFTPILAMGSLGNGSLTFTLTDLNGVYGDSGQFVYNVSATTAVPEPTSMILTAFAASVFGAVGLRRRRTRENSEAP